MVVWILGQPCSGKSTLANLLISQKSKYPISVYQEIGYEAKIHNIDADVFREVFSNKNYGREGRIMNVSNAANIAKYLNWQGEDVICSFVTPYAEMRNYIIELMGENVKFVYLTYNEGEARGREGYHVNDFEIPEGENLLTINTSNCTEEQAAQMISNFCLNLKNQ